MDLNRVQQFTDIIHNNISYTGLEGAVMSTPIFNRLHHVLQSSLVYLTYSSNKVKRFEHSVGTMFLSGEILYNSIINFPGGVAENQLIEELNQAVKNWFDNIDIEKEKMINDTILESYNKDSIVASAPVPNCPLYTRYFPHHFPKDTFFSYSVLFQATRLAGLLHDVGHLPYSHVFEYATKLLYSMIEDVSSKNQAQRSFLSIMEKYCKGKNELHEELGISLLKQIKFEVSSELEKNISHENLFVIAVFDFTEKILNSSPFHNDLFSDIHRIISGSLDSDRLDYCSRDALCSGVTKYVFPYKRLFSTYRIMTGHLEYDDDDGKYPERKRILFCPALKSITEIEELLDRRWKIFTQINYHHRVHKHEIIFSEILAHVGFLELENMQDDIPEISTGDPLPLNVWSIWAITKLLTTNKRSIDYLIIQLDDSWMDTLLKTSFFNKYKTKYRDKDMWGADATWNMFDELISTKKHYYSFFKRNEDYMLFDNKIRESWLQKYDKANSEEDKDLMKYKVAARMKEQSQKKMPDKFSLYLILSELNTNELNFYQDVEKKVNQFLNENKTLSIRHCLIRPCNFSLGYNVVSPIYLWTNEDSLDSFTQVSKKVEYLHQLKYLNLPFHLYYLPCNANDKETSKSLNILEDKVIEIIIDVLGNQCEKEI